MSNLKHGMHGTRTYKIWKQMRWRVSPNYKERTYYFDKGIGVCSEWDDFNQFLSDMGECPDGLSLDRIDGNDGYYKDNCRWADATAQSNNRDYVNKYLYKGSYTSLGALEKLTGISRKTLWARINKGWSVERSVETPLKKRLRL